MNQKINQKLQFLQNNSNNIGKLKNYFFPIKVIIKKFLNNFKIFYNEKM